MCHGEPDTIDAPSLGPPPDRFQYADWARWPPQARSTAGPDAWNGVVMSRLEWPVTGPAWVTGEIDRIVPPQIVSRRGAAEDTWAPWTDRPCMTNGSTW